MKANYDIVVIGFGKAGKTLAAKFSKSGKSVALIEKDKNMYGGTCINVGCIPSKRLITDASKSPNGEFEKKAQHYKEAVAEKKKLIAALNKANYDKIAAAGVDIIDGTASFKDDHHIIVTTEDGNVEIEAEKFIINTGSVTVIPKIEGADSKGVYTSESMMNLDELPKGLTIVGGGYIGLEFASMYADFGSKVTVVQDGDVFLPREDEDIAKAIRDVLEAKNVEIVTGAKVTKVDEGKLYYEKKLKLFKKIFYLRKFEINLSDIDDIFILPPKEFYHDRWTKDIFAKYTEYFKPCKRIKIKLIDSKEYTVCNYVKKREYNKVYNEAAEAVFQTIANNIKDFIFEEKENYKFQKELENLEEKYNLPVEERYNFILNKIIDEEILFVARKDGNYIINGIDGKEVTMSKLKDDINEIRDSKSTFI